MASVSPQSPFYRTTDASERAFGRNAPVADGGVFMRHEMLAVPGTGALGDGAGVALDANTVTVRVRVSPRLYAGRVAGVGFIAPAGAVVGTTYSAIVDGNTYTAVPIARGAVEATSETARLALNITCARDLPVLGLPGSAIETASRDANVRFVAEGFADRAYTPEDVQAIKDMVELCRV